MQGSLPQAYERQLFHTLTPILQVTDDFPSSNEILFSWDKYGQPVGGQWRK